MTVPMLRRRIGCALAVAALLTACGSAQELGAEEAEEHYETALTEAQEALAPLGYEFVHAPRTRSYEMQDGECLYTPGNYEADGLSADLGDEENWDELLEALNPVLDEHGFGTADKPRREGALLMVVVEDSHGATLSIGQNGTLRIHGARVAAEACDGV